MDTQLVITTSKVEGRKNVSVCESRHKRAERSKRGGLSVGDVVDRAVVENNTVAASLFGNELWDHKIVFNRGFNEPNL